MAATKSESADEIDAMHVTRQSTNRHPKSLTYLLSQSFGLVRIHQKKGVGVESQVI